MNALLVILFVGLAAALNTQGTSIQQNRAELKKCGILLPGAMIADVRGCAKYLVCNNGELHQFSCLNSYSFDQKTQMCVYNLSCWNDERDMIGPQPILPILPNGPSVTNPCYGRPTGSFLPSSLSCRQFYHCNQGQSSIGICPVGYAFSSLKSVCVPKETACF